MPTRAEVDADRRRGPFDDFRPEVRSALPWLVFYRFLSNVGVRFPYSFLPALARGAGISIEGLGQVLFARELTGSVAPFVGRASDRRGSVRMIRTAAVIGVVGLVVGALGRIGLVIGLVTFGLAKIAFDVSSNAWIGQQVAYERRGRAMGIVEMTWAAAALLGLPVLGLAIDRIGWWSASALLAVLALPAAAGIFATLGRGEPVGAAASSSGVPTITVPLLATIGGFCALTSASQFLIVGHGLWLDDVYGLSAAGVGFAVMSVGVVEAIGSSSSSQLTDRWGKRNSVLGGSVLMAAALGALTLFPAPRLALGLLLLALAFLGFEFALVSALPLLVELDPRARAQVMGWSLGLSTVLRAVGSLVGIWLYERSGFALLTGSGAVIALLAIALLGWFSVEPGAST